MFFFIFLFIFFAFNNTNGGYSKSARLSIVLPHLPEVSSRHPAPGAEWPRVTHVRVKGWRERWGSGDEQLGGRFFFSLLLLPPAMLSYMAITPAVRQAAVGQGSSWRGTGLGAGRVVGGGGSAEGKRTAVTVVRSPPPRPTPPLLLLTTTTRRRRRRKRRRKPQQGRDGNVRTLTTIPVYFHLIPSFRRQRR